MLIWRTQTRITNLFDALKSDFERLFLAGLVDKPAILARWQPIKALAVDVLTTGVHACLEWLPLTGQSPRKTWLTRQHPKF